MDLLIVSSHDGPPLDARALPSWRSDVRGLVSTARVGEGALRDARLLCAPLTAERARAIETGVALTQWHARHRTAARAAARAAMAETVHETAPSRAEPAVPPMRERPATADAAAADVDVVAAVVADAPSASPPVSPSVGVLVAHAQGCGLPRDAGVVQQAWAWLQRASPSDRRDAIALVEWAPPPPSATTRAYKRLTLAEAPTAAMWPPTPVLLLSMAGAARIVVAAGAAVDTPHSSLGAACARLAIPMLLYVNH